jgi:hypothetical protein
MVPIDAPLGPRSTPAMNSSIFRPKGAKPGRDFRRRDDVATIVVQGNSLWPIARLHSAGEATQ